MHMLKIRIIGWLMLFMSPCLVFAANNWTIDSFKHVEFSIAAGPNWARAGSSYLIVSPFESDSVLNNHITNDAAWKMGVGYHFFDNPNPQRNLFSDFVLELNLYQTSEVIDGNVWQYQDPEYNNYQFSAPVTSNRFMLDIKPGIFTFHPLSLYGIFGAGVVWNSISYNETITGEDVEAGSELQLTNNTEGTFAYDLGAGIRADFGEHLSASLEYIYANLNSMSPSETSKNSVVIDTPPKFRIYNQSVLFGISWKI